MISIALVLLSQRDGTGTRAAKYTKGTYAPNDVLINFHVSSFRFCVNEQGMNCLLIHG
jgi:hypothetical protein